ncbi:hypothetical protein CH372_17065 [Leptospira meyeri]|nr:hypothetical protein CH372_17065 [Leptospira meyeri]PKA22343.1 hypothetical protein CH381_31385 [Leptospira sp. mixed culture ATI2-C-A1]
MLRYESYGFYSASLIERWHRSLSSEAYRRERIQVKISLQRFLEKWKGIEQESCKALLDFDSTDLVTTGMMR